MLTHSSLNSSVWYVCCVNMVMVNCMTMHVSKSLCHATKYMTRNCLFCNQAHLLGIFENVNTVDFHEKNYDNILAVVSREGEKIKVHVPMQCIIFSTINGCKR